MTTRLLDETKHHAESEASALVPSLGGVKRLEYPIHDLLCHAAPSVTDLDHHILARHELRVRRNRISVEAAIGCSDRQASTAGHRVARIGREICNGRFQLRRVGYNGRNLWREAEHDWPAGFGEPPMLHSPVAVRATGRDSNRKHAPPPRHERGRRPTPRLAAAPITPSPTATGLRPGCASRSPPGT